MKNLIPIEYQGQRILTTAQLAESYEADTQLIINNFNRNKDRYIEGKHYFTLEGEAKRLFIDQHQIDLGSKNAKALYLWTEKGAWLHAKSLNTDKAWEAYEMLVDDYYSIKQLQPKDSYMIEDPIERAKAWIVEAEEKKALQLQIQADKPFANFGKSIANSSDSITIGEFAKVCNNKGIQIGRNRLFDWMRDKGYLIKRGREFNNPKQSYVEQGLFELKEAVVHTVTEDLIRTTTLLTGKGQMYFLDKLQATLPQTAH